MLLEICFVGCIVVLVLCIAREIVIPLWRFFTMVDTLIAMYCMFEETLKQMKPYAMINITDNKGFCIFGDKFQVYEYFEKKFDEAMDFYNNMKYTKLYEFDPKNPCTLRKNQIIAITRQIKKLKMQK